MAKHEIRGSEFINGSFDEKGLPRNVDYTVKYKEGRHTATRGFLASDIENAKETFKHLHPDAQIIELNKSSKIIDYSDPNWAINESRKELRQLKYTINRIAKGETSLMFDGSKEHVDILAYLGEYEYKNKEKGLRLMKEYFPKNSPLKEFQKAVIEAEKIIEEDYHLAGRDKDRFDYLLEEEYYIQYKDGGVDRDLVLNAQSEEMAEDKFYEMFNGPDEMIWDVVVKKSYNTYAQEKLEIITFTEALDADCIDQASITLYKEGSKFKCETVYNNGEPAVIKELTEVRAFEMCITSGIIIHGNVLDRYFDKEMMKDYADSLRVEPDNKKNEKRIDKMNFTQLSESYSEQLNTFKQFVVNKSNLEKGDNKALEAALTNTLEKITDKDLKVITKQYAAESFKAGMFKSQDKILENSLKEFYIKINEHLTKDRDFSIKIVNEPGVLKQIKMEAHTLNKGDLNYGNEIAAKEVTHYRSALIKADKQVRSLQDETSFLRGKVNRLNATITNILNNVKETFKVDNSELKKLVVGNSKDIKLIADENTLKNKFGELQALGVNSKNEIFEGVKINNGEELVWMKPDESTLKKVQEHIKITDEGVKFLTIVKGDTSQGKERGQSISR